MDTHRKMTNDKGQKIGEASKQTGKLSNHHSRELNHGIKRHLYKSGQNKLSFDCQPDHKFGLEEL